MPCINGCTRKLPKVLTLLLYGHQLTAKVAAHAIMTNPEPRPNIVAPGVKLQPFNNARQLANSGCGGIPNADPGVQLPKLAFTPGARVQVDWQLTIPHPADVEDTGVRIAIHYGPGDSFEQNILVGRVEGDPGNLLPQTAGPVDAVANQIQSITVDLPLLKTCNYCTLQWIWAARQDGGSYISCADIAITTNGLLPNFGQLPSQVGNVLPGVPGETVGTPPGGGGATPGQPGQPVGGSNQNGTCKNSSAAVPVVIGILFGLFFSGLGLFAYRRVTAVPQPPKAAERSSLVQVQGLQTAPAPPASGGKGGLPTGWTEVKDPASGRPYFYNSNTGQTSWTPPSA